MPQLSTGDLLRAAASAETPLGREADVFMRAGQLVPDELVLRILKARLEESDARNGFILDGYPRTVDQAKALAEMVAIDAVIAFEIPESELVERLTQRRACPRCGTIYNLKTQPPKVRGRCDREGAELIQRPDDAVEAVKTRLAVFHEKTTPLIDFYRKRGLLRPVDATGTPGTVTRRILDALGARPA